MKILHIVEDFSIESGGLRTVIKDLNNYLNQDIFSSYILSSKKESEDNIFTVNTNLPWQYSKNWLLIINSLHRKYKFDVFHIHGVWMYPQFIAAKFCLKNNIPFILSTHGMYEPWLWKKGAFKKKLYFKYLTESVFKKAKFIHAITPQENTNLSKIFKNSKIFEIPNLIKEIIYNKDLQSFKEEKYILYLGRLDEKKGIDILLKAFSNIKTKSVKIKIAGKINGYHKILEELIVSLEIQDKVEFLGIVTGEVKTKLIKNAIVLVAPSHSEVIGMVNLEGAILKTPVITTYQTGLDPAWNSNGGILINPNLDELKEAIKIVLGWSSEKRNENGKKLYKFVKKNYSWSERFKDWKKTYISCANK